jgi:hypothetical protein
MDRGDSNKSCSCDDIFATMVVDAFKMTYDLTSSFPTLRNAPITEAIIDIATELSPDVSLDQLHTFYDGLEQCFPIIERRDMVEAVLDVEASVLSGSLKRGPSQSCRSR